MKILLAIFILSIGSALIVPLGTAQNAKTAATIAGKWHFVLDTEGGDREVESVLQQDGDQVTGKWGPGDAKGTFTEGKLNLEFPMTSEEAGPGTMKVKGVLAADDTLSGDWAFNEYSGTFKATRVKE
jgi:hypothetical protein